MLAFRAQNLLLQYLRITLDDARMTPSPNFQASELVCGSSHRVSTELHLLELDVCCDPFALVRNHEAVGLSSDHFNNYRHILVALHPAGHWLLSKPRRSNPGRNTLRELKIEMSLQILALF